MDKAFDIFAYLMGKAAGGGGGGDVTVESKSIDANGTYTAPTGKAYSPVSVSVPNSYAAGDEGKVVSNGALVAQGSDTVTQNGTVDTTLINSLTVNVSGGGGYGYTKLAEQDFTVSTSSTSAVDVGSINVPGLYQIYNDKSKIVYVRVRDKAGQRSDYFFGTDNYLLQPVVIRFVLATVNGAPYNYGNKSAGVYVTSIDSDSNVVLTSTYNANISKTINGTYHVEVYALDWPDGVSPFAT